MSFLKATVKFVFALLINSVFAIGRAALLGLRSILMSITMGILKYSLSGFVHLMKYAIKQIIWYLAIFLKFAVFKIIQFIFQIPTETIRSVPKRQKKQQYYLDVMTDDETDYETDDE